MVDKQRLSTRVQQWLGVSVAVTVMLAWAALPTDWWVSVFGHPLRDPTPDATWHGAMLWRCMLVLSAICLVAAHAWWHRCAAQADSRFRLLEPRTPWTRDMGYAVTLLLVIAAALRATRLDESFWYDEVAAWREFGQYGPGTIIGNYYDPANHIFQTLLSWLSLEALGSVTTMEVAVRAPSIIASLLTVIVMFELGRRVVGTAGGVAAGLLAAVLPVLVLEAVEARGYALMICAAATATWLWWTALDTGRPCRWSAYAVVSALGVWAHPLTAFVMIGHGAVALWWITRGTTRVASSAIVAVILAGIFTITLYAPAMFDFIQNRQMFAATSDHQPGLLGTEGLHAVIQFGGAWTWWAAIAGGVAAGLGCCRAIRRQRLRIVAVTMLIGLPIMLGVIVVAGTWVYARFMLFALPGMMVLMAGGIAWLWTLAPPRRHLGRYAVSALTASIITTSIVDLMTRPPKQPLREAAMLVRSNMRVDDDVLVIGLAHGVMDIYLSDLPLHFSPLHGIDLDEHLADPPAWAIVLYPRHVGARRVAALRASGYDQVAHVHGWADWGNGDVLVYRLAPGMRHFE